MNFVILRELIDSFTSSKEKKGEKRRWKTCFESIICRVAEARSVCLILPQGKAIAEC